MTVQNKKVIAQELVKTKDAIPAHYESMKKEYPHAIIAIENNKGQIVYTDK
jgi:hypothetical protein